VLRDAFEALFHPDGRMALSRAVMRGYWWLFHLVGAHRPRLFALAGPAMLLTILMLWAALLAIGWAFVLWPHFPDGFRFADELGPDAGQRGLVDALYMSLVTLGTIGYGHISPASDLLRLLVPLEALVGFALLTASVSWLLTVYPALSRRRSLAYEITLLREVTRRGAATSSSAAGAAPLNGCSPSCSRASWPSSAISSRSRSRSTSPSATIASASPGWCRGC